MNVLPLAALALTVLMTLGACRAPEAGLTSASSVVTASPRSDTVEVPSAAMRRSVRVVVATPGGRGPWPVVTLLHGHGGDAANWARQLGPGGLEAMAARFGVVIACPDGTADSWYLDAPRDPAVRFETFLARELPAWLDRRPDTRRDRAGRAITGLSMGGHGALFVALRHADVYGAAASMSGGVDLAQYPDRWGIARLVGPWPQDSSAWHAHSVVRLAARVDTAGLPRLAFDVGTGDFFLDPNRRLHDVLTRRGIAHDYAERPGQHTWDYWRRALPLHLAFFREGFDAAPAR